MSLLDNGTKANPSVLYYSGGGGGGGGGVTVTTSSLTVSSISGLAGGQIEMNTLVQISSIGGALGPNSLTVVQNGFEFLTGGEARFNADGVISFQDNLGQITGVSTINGVAYPQANANMTSFNLESGGNFYVPAGGATVPMASFSTTQFHLYQMELPFLRVQNEPVGIPQEGAWADMTIDTAVNTTYLDTFDMASVSTIANDLQKAAVYSFVASGANHTLSASGNLANTLSTAITVTGKGYLKDLGAITSYPSAN